MLRRRFEGGIGFSYGQGRGSVFSSQIERVLKG